MRTRPRPRVTGPFHWLLAVPRRWSPSTCRIIWVLAVGAKVNGAASAGAHSVDFSNYSNYIAIGVALLFVYMGHLHSGARRKGRELPKLPRCWETPKRVRRRASEERKRAPSFFENTTTTSGERVNEARTKRRRRVRRVQFCKSYHPNPLRSFLVTN